jgi:hypothetical protein
MGFVHVKHDDEQFNLHIRDRSKPVGNRPVMIPGIMRACMLAPFESFIPLGTLGIAKEGSPHQGRHIYIDRGSKILGVAHLDSVQKPSHFWSNKHTIACPTIDNRLGVWILLHGLPSLGIYPDVLLTENEEKGASTAFDFRPSDPRWNWMFSFDRGVNGTGKGRDVVLYQYDGGELEKALKQGNFTVGIGSYSCIAELDHLGIEGVNVGCTMTDYHGDKAYAKIPELADQMVQFAAFYTKHEQTRFEYKAKQWNRKRSKRNTTTNYHYHNGSWESGDDYMYGHNYNQGYGQPTTHFTRINNAVARLRREGDTLAVIGRAGFDTYLDGCASVEEWRDMSTVPVGHEGKEVPNTCKRCEQDFFFRDTTYSYYFSRLYCKACYLEVMDVMGLLPPTWTDELNNSKLLPLLEQIEGESDAKATHNP